MLHKTIFVLYVQHKDGREMPVEPVSVCDFGVWDENQQWMEEEKERKMKEYGVDTAKWVELTLSKDTFVKVENSFADILLNGETK